MLLPSGKMLRGRAPLTAGETAATREVEALVAALKDLRDKGHLVDADGVSHLDDLDDDGRSGRGRHLLDTLLENVTAEALGISQEHVAALAAKDDSYHAGSHSFYYQPVHSDNNVTVGVFMIPANSMIPLHNHPKMEVIGRLLFGRMQIASLDLLHNHDDPHFISCPTPSPTPNPPPVPASTSRARSMAAQDREQGRGTSGLMLPAVVRSDREYGPSPVSIYVKPQCGNIHQLTANSHAAFIDIIFPPYDTKAGRACTFYTREDIVDVNGTRQTFLKTAPQMARLFEKIGRAHV